MRIVVLLISLLLCCSSYAESVGAQVDRNKIAIDETLELIIRMESASSGARPDLTGLHQDFSIVTNSQNTSVSWLNGLVTHLVSWRFTLQPSRTGKLIIPGLPVGALKTNSIEIEVVAASDRPARVADDRVLLEAEVKPLNPYVQGQMLYTQRLYNSRPLLDNATITRPRLLEGRADIEYLGASNPVITRHNGQQYQFMERYFAVFPQRSGKLKFAASVFRGAVRTNAGLNRFGQGRSYFQNDKITASSVEVDIEVLEKPDTVEGNEWLPASQLIIQGNWSADPETVRVGEPITLTLGMIADGLRAESLPEIKLDLPEGLRAYPTEPDFNTRKVNSGVSGVRQDAITLIANKDGAFTLPEIRLAWWNTNTNQQEFAAFKPEALVVGSGVAAPVPAQPLVGNTESDQEDAATEGKDPEVTPQAGAEVSVNSTEDGAEQINSGVALGFWSQLKHWVEVPANLIALLTGLGALLLFGILIYFLRSRHQSPEMQHRREALHVQKQVLDACRKNDVELALKALPDWAASVGVEPPTLAGLSQSSDVKLRNAIDGLSRSRYAAGAGSWDGATLKAAISEYQRSDKDRAGRSGLEQLHPVS